MSVNVAAYSYQKSAAQIVARLLNTDDEFGVKGSYTIEGNTLKFSTYNTPTPPTVNYYGEIEMSGDVISLVYNYHTYKNIRKYNFIKIQNIL